MVASRPRTAPGVRRTPLQARSTRRVADLLAAAAGLADERGYDEVTTADIAARAGVSIGSLYRFFADKQAVYRALALVHLDRFLDRLEHRLADDDQTTWDRLVDATVDTYVDMRRTV